MNASLHVEVEAIELNPVSFRAVYMVPALRVNGRCLRAPIG